MQYHIIPNVEYPKSSLHVDLEMRSAFLGHEVKVKEGDKAALRTRNADVSNLLIC